MWVLGTKHALCKNNKYPLLSHLPAPVDLIFGYSWRPSILPHFDRRNGSCPGRLAWFKHLLPLSLPRAELCLLHLTCLLHGPQEWWFSNHVSLLHLASTSSSLFHAGMVSMATPGCSTGSWPCWMAEAGWQKRSKSEEALKSPGKSFWWNCNDWNLKKKCY